MMKTNDATARRITLCACGKRMSQYSRECRACYAVSQQRWQARIADANTMLARTTVTTSTFAGEYRVLGIDDQCCAACAPVGQSASNWNRRTFHLHGGHVEAILRGETKI